VKKARGRKGEELVRGLKSLLGNGKLPRVEGPVYVSNEVQKPTPETLWHPSMHMLTARDLVIKQDNGEDIVDDSLFVSVDKKNIENVLSQIDAGIQAVRTDPELAKEVDSFVEAYQDGMLEVIDMSLPQFQEKSQEEIAEYLAKRLLVQVFDTYGRAYLGSDKHAAAWNIRREDIGMVIKDFMRKSFANEMDKYVPVSKRNALWNATQHSLYNEIDSIAA